MATSPSSSNAKHVLIVDDDEQFRDILGKTLQDSGYVVHEAASGNAAKALVEKAKVDIVVSDIRMPDGNGIDLLEYVKTRDPKLPSIPVVLMTGFSELLETKQAYEMGADGFLNKPFNRAPLLQTLQSILNPKAASAAALPDLDKDFCKVNIDDFATGKQILSDVHVRLSASKYAVVSNKGENISPDKIKFYKKNHVRYLYLKREDFRKHFGYTLFQLRPADQMDLAKKEAFFKRTGEIIGIFQQQKPMDQEAFDYAKTVLENAISLMYESDPTHEFLNTIATHTKLIYPRTIATALYSMMIAKHLNWTSSMNQFKIAVGAIFHDLGEKEIDPAILLKKRDARTSEESKAWEKHPLTGASMLSKINEISDDIIQIVVQHHENHSGTGFPAAQRKSQIQPLSRIVAAADLFVHLILAAPSGEGLSPQQAVDRIEHEKPPLLDPQMVTAIRQIFSLN